MMPGKSHGLNYIACKCGERFHSRSAYETHIAEAWGR